MAKNYHKNMMLKMMGKLVKVSHVLHKSRTGGNVTWKILKRNKQLIGWVTGFSYRMEGKITYEYDTSSFEESNRIPCILITPWPTMRQIEVPMEATLIETTELPLSPQNKSWLDTPDAIKETVRKECREFALNQKRGEKGKFVK